MQRAATAAVIFASLFAAGAAQAQNTDNWDGGYDVTAHRRSGFVASASIGLGAGVATGYPNELAKIDEPAYESAIDGGLGSVNTLWVGGALTDWFNFGLGLLAFGASKGDIKMNAGGFIVHLEGFPLWSLGGAYRDFSVYTNLGAGSLTMEGGPEKAESGLLSMLGLGVSHELVRLGHFAFGPTLETVYTYSEAADAFGVFLGARAAFYGGP